MSRKEFADAVVSILSGNDYPVKNVQDGLIEVEHYTLGGSTLEKICEVSKENFIGFLVSRDFNSKNLQILY